MNGRECRELCEEIDEREQSKRLMDRFIAQLRNEADAYRRERDAAHHVIIQAGIVPVKDTQCDCDQCRSVLEGMQRAGYA
jgi:5,10-methylenetetrahydrofolate reductase